MQTVVLSSAYWPNLQYFYYILNAQHVFIEKHEHYQKQSFRNRTQILSANGVLNLTIPIKNYSEKKSINEVEIFYKEKWQKNHWRAIESAYKNSPYFEFFEEEIKMFYSKEYQFLFEYNNSQLECLLKILRVKKQILFSDNFEKEFTDKLDLRNSIHPKLDFNLDKQSIEKISLKYYQTFEDKFKFTPNLSILDLIFNKGLEAVDYLSEKNL